MYEKHYVRAICYKTVVPHYFEKGTPWEKTKDHFLAFITCEPLEKAIEIARELNETRPNGYNGRKFYDFDINEVDYFYAVEQEDF